MMDMEYKIENGKIVIKLAGRVDSANAAEAEGRIAAFRENAPALPIVLDCGKLSYISSAGLRVILRVKKSQPDTALVNVSPEIYEIFEMTGFTEMMEVKRSFRVIDVTGCEVIGQGANGKVYRIDPDTIVKVYLNPDSLPDIERERELARTAFVLGVPTAIPYDVVRIAGEGRDAYGSVFELLNATSYAKMLVSGEKSVDEIAKMSVDLLKLIHSTVVKPGIMPDMKAVALDWAEFLEPHLPREQYEKLRALIEAVPQDQHMMHGDYHIKNVMYQNGESLLIDMDTLCTGHPVFEFASIYNAYCGFSELDHKVVENFLGITRQTSTLLWRKMLALYFGTEDEKVLKEIEKKATVISYTRILRRTIRRIGEDKPEGRAIIENCRAHLTDLLSKVDTLVF